jgi:futalosine hydrolase
MAGPDRSGSGSPTLLLIPTELERRRLDDCGGFPPGLALRALCGFGPIAAAARAAALIARLRPRRVLLLGIAGAYDVELDPIGSARCFESVAVEGVGAGEGAQLRGPSALGFPQWPGTPEDPTTTIEERMVLARPEAGPTVRPLLLTTCAASDGAEQAALRRARHPEAAAEDMEAFAVASACALERVPCAVVRGISNLVGDRDARNWRIPAALAAAREAALSALESNWTVDEGEGAR